MDTNPGNQSRPLHRDPLAWVFTILVTAAVVIASWPPIDPPSLVSESELIAMKETLQASGPMDSVPGEGGEIVVAEQGLSLLSDDYVSIGAVLDNTSDKLAATAQVEFAVRDSEGNDVGDYESFYGSDHVYIPPGGTAVLGRGGLPTSPGTELKISIKDTEWWPPKQGLGEVNVTDLETPEGYRAEAPVKFNVDSGVEPSIPAPQAALLYRNEDGDLIGGDLITLDGYSNMIPYGTSARSGELNSGAPKDTDNKLTTGHISLSGLPPWW